MELLTNTFSGKVRIITGVLAKSKVPGNFLLIVYFSTLFFQSPAISSHHPCPAATEYITTFKYLSENKHGSLPSSNKDEIARQVAKGCVGAANRYIKTSNLLYNAEISRNAVIREALTAAKGSPEQFRTFYDVFTFSYARDGLDLSAAQSLRFAHQAAAISPIPLRYVPHDFKALAKACSHDLSKGSSPGISCSEWAINLMQDLPNFPHGLSNEVALINEAINEFSEELPVKARIKLFSVVLNRGPGSGANFLKALSFFRDKHANASRVEAVKFALSLTPESDSRQSDKRGEK